MDGEVIPVGDVLEQDADSGRYQVKELKTKHKQALSLLAQGVSRKDVAIVCDYTPEYISMICAMPIAQAYLSELTQVAAVQLEGMFVKTVDVISNVMENGNMQEQLKAARLQMEATKRIGAAGANALTVADGGDRLERLAHRLIGLLDKQQTASGRTLDGDFQQAN